MTLAEVEAAVMKWVPHIDVDSATIRTAIGLAENEFYRSLRMRGDQITVTPTIGGGGEYIEHPADWNGWVRLQIVGNPSPIEIVTEHEYTSRQPWQSQPVTGYPRVAVVRRGNTYLYPWAGTNAVSAIYYQKFIGLVTSGTNWISAEHPDLYIYATAAHLHTMKGDVEKAQVAKMAAGAILRSMGADENKKRWGGSPLVMRVR